MELSIHDNQIISYSVYSQKREIHFQTIFSDKKPIEYTDVIFSDVIIYHFECDNFNSILFDINEITLEETFLEYELIFSKLKNYCWIIEDYKNEEELIQKMKAQNIRAFGIHSSFGLSGWVWAKNMMKIKREIQ